MAAARQAARHAWCRYSKFNVGAALQARDGRVFLGCNVENASYGLTVCAERVAIWKAISEGVRGFRRLALYTPTRTPSVPCGACRQVLAEFAPKLELLIGCDSSRVRRVRLDELMPEPFVL